MATGALLEIRLYEDDRKNWFSRSIYEEIVLHLWSKGAPGVTVFRDEEGLDAKGHRQDIKSDYTSGLPIEMHVYGLMAEVDEVLRELSNYLTLLQRSSCIIKSLILR